MMIILLCDYLDIKQLDLDMQMTLSELDLDPQKNCEVFLRLDNGNGTRAQVNRLTTIKQFKESLKNIKIQLPLCFQLVWAGKCITDESYINETFESLKIANKSIIHIQNAIPHSQREIKIDIWIFYRGQKMVIKSRTEETIMNLKEKIYNVLRILPKYQLLVFQSQKLQNHRKVSEYNIKNNSLICLKNQGPNVEQENIFINNESTILIIPDNLVLCTNSANIEHQRNKRTIFNSQYYQNRPVYEVQIKQEKNQTFSLDLIQQKDFNFDLLHPKTYELNNQEEFKIDMSTDTSYKMKKQLKNKMFEKDLGLGLTESINPGFKLQ